MKNHTLLFVLGVMVTLSSCEKVVLENEEYTVDADGVAKLTISTRIGGGEENAVAHGRIYIFNQAGTCVQMLSTDEESNSAVAHLAAGSYSLYAVGVDDLTRFVLPTKENATTTSTITRAEGKVMDDLLMKKADVVLEDGVDQNVTIALEHKVLSLSEVEIKKVPTNVTKVEVTLLPLYSSICLDGTYPDTPTENYKIALTQQSDGKTWKAQPNQMLFPSKGTPTINISFTTAEGTRSYSYTASEALPANHHLTISGTYTAAQGVNITGILTTADWGEDITITFDFDDNNSIASAPVAGQKYNDYNVVSVDEDHHTAVLLAKSVINYVTPADGSSNEVWEQALATAMSGLAKPTGVTNNWRIPTRAEINTILQNSNWAYLDTNGYTSALFSLYNDNVYYSVAHYENEEYEFTHGEDFDDYPHSIYFWPVINISY